MFKHTFNDATSSMLLLFDAGTNHVGSISKGKTSNNFRVCGTFENTADGSYSSGVAEFSKTNLSFFTLTLATLLTLIQISFS